MNIEYIQVLICNESLFSRNTLISTQYYNWNLTKNKNPVDFHHIGSLTFMEQKAGRFPPSCKIRTVRNKNIVDRRHLLKYLNNA